MTWHLTTDVAEFDLAAKEFLLADPVGNTVLLTVAATVTRNGREAYGDDPPQFGWYRPDGGAVQGAFVRTPPRSTLVSGLPAGAVEELLTIEEAAHSVSGPVEAVTALADAWAAASGRGSTFGVRRRLYRLVELTPPSPMPEGAARAATPADLDLIVAWYDDFTRLPGFSGTTPVHLIEERLRKELILLWEVDGVPVSMAGVTLPAGGAARVAPVYTPAELRGHGYAGAVTAAVSRRAQEAGDEVLLFTDLDNPTSNALYQRIGYRPVRDYLDAVLER